MSVLSRKLKVYGAFSAMVPKMFMAYSVWVWMQFVVQIIAIMIFVAFWTAVYEGETTLSGLALNDTLNYIILAQLFMPAAQSTGIIFFFGQLMRDGRVGIELLRPVDFQLAQYFNSIARIFTGLVVQIPLAIVAWLLFRFQLPTDPLIWGAFLVTMLLGTGALFFFDWMIGCVSFYSTETWGLGVLRFSISGFFSGLLVPLAMMPDWLRTIADVLPFSQALYYPVSILSGITPLSEVPGLWLNQLIYLVVFGVLSRIVFNISVRKVTVQGG